jgi:hypothetical protein
MLLTLRRTFVPNSIGEGSVKSFDGTRTIDYSGGGHTSTGSAVMSRSRGGNSDPGEFWAEGERCASGTYT